MSKFIVKTKGGTATFRRAGRDWTAEEQTVDSSDLSEDEVAQLRAEMAAEGSPLEIREEGGPAPAQKGGQVGAQTMGGNLASGSGPTKNEVQTGGAKPDGEHSDDTARSGKRR